MKTLFTAVVAVTLLVPVLKANAHSFDSLSVQSREVFYGDLDLRSEAGLARLHARIVGAARIVCGDEGRTTIQMTNAVNDCRAQAISNAVSSVNLAQLSSLSTIKVAQR